MKFATTGLLGILLLGSSASLYAQAAATSKVVMAYLNEPDTMRPDGHPDQPPVPDGFDGVCLIYYTMIGDLDLKSLFSGPLFGAPVIDRAHAHFIWVSDFKAQVLTDNGKYTLVLIPEGTGTVYYSSNPESRIWTDATRSTWGDPVAKFVRKASIFQSADGGVSGTFISSAELVSSKPFPLNGKTFDLKDLIPQGMNCFETADDVYEVGTCVAIK
jgi:hypothetical protein